MYVCFGFLVARLRRARTIDLQCKSLSLSSIFASQRVSASAPHREELCRSLASSLAKSIENHRENRSKIDPRRSLGAPKIDSKSVRDPLAAPRGAQERPEGVSGASRERLGSVSERPRRPPGASGGSPWAPRDAGKSARERLGACRGDQNRRQVASRSEKIEFVSRGAFAKHHRSDF